MSSSTNTNANANMSSTHLFFCINNNCENTSMSGQQCVDCAEWAEACAEQADCSIALPPPCEGCPGCGCELWGVLLGTNGYCGPCWQQRYGLLACHGSSSSVADTREECQMCGDMAAPGDSEESGWVCDECFEALDHHENCNETRDMCYCLRVQRRIDEVKPQDERDAMLACETEPTHVCNGEWDYDLGYRVCDNSDDKDCPQHEPRCTCDGSGLVCPSCNVEYHENCRGCGAFTNLGLGDYCSSCYLPPLPPSPPPPTPRHTSLESMRAEIAEIEARLLTNMTKRQKDDWVWILQNRRADLAEAEKEMWEQYDDDDLRKLDLQCRR